VRCLRCLPTNLTGPEIAGELYVWHNTVKAHVRNLYAKLGTHSRAETVTRARNLGPLGPTARSARCPVAQGIGPEPRGIAAGTAVPQISGADGGSIGAIRVTLAHPAGQQPGPTARQGHPQSPPGGYVTV